MCRGPRRVEGGKELGRPVERGDGGEGSPRASEAESAAEQIVEADAWGYVWEALLRGVTNGRGGAAFGGAA